MTDRKARFRDLPLFWKLLVPFLTLMLIVGMLGAFVIVRDLSQRAQTQLDSDLARRSLDARSLLHDRELYLLESASFAANLQGIADSLRHNDSQGVEHLLASVRALKTDLDFVVAANQNGTGIVEFTRTGDTMQQGTATNWATEDFIRNALASDAGAKTSGFLRIGSTVMFAIAAPVCSDVTACAPTGITITGIRADRLAQAAAISNGGVGIFNLDGRRLAAARIAPDRERPQTSTHLVRRRETLHGTDTETLASPLTVQGRRIGTFTVSVPTRPAFAAVRNAGRRLALVLLAAMAGIVAIGAMLSRFILGQVRPLVSANRALGTGDLSARAPVMGHDELGELATGFNEMAVRLQANVETLELRVEERTEEIRRLLRERTEFFAGLSHEFRTPLAIIRNQADLVAEDATDAAMADAGRVMSTSAEQLLELVNDILDTARAEVSSVDVELEPVRLSDVVNGLKPNLADLAQSAGLRLSTKVPANLPTVYADPTRLREVVLNLVDNAVKYTPDGGKVDVTAAAVNGHVELAVRDTGVGIPLEARDRMFQPFYRVRGTRTQRGQSSSGLGLALTKRLVEAQGGSIDFTSTPGEGSTFVVKLQPARD